jgi:hypothetical protein
MELQCVPLCCSLVAFGNDSRLNMWFACVFHTRRAICLLHCWFFHHLLCLSECNYNPPIAPACIQVKPALPALARLIHSNDEEVLTDACWALSYLSDGANDKIQGVIDAGVCSRLVELLL